MTSLSIRLPVVLKERITLKAFSLGLTATEYIRALAEQHLGDEPLIAPPEPEPAFEPVATTFHPECDHPSARRVGEFCMVCHREVGSAL